MNKNDQTVLELLDSIEEHLTKASLSYEKIESKKLLIAFHLNKKLGITYQDLQQLRKDVLETKTLIKMYIKAEEEN